MCLYTSHVKPKVAKEDIICYKIMYYKPRNVHKAISIYQGFRYKLGTLYKSELIYHIYKTVHEGFHSYKNLKDAINKRLLISRYLKEIKIFKCIIPKGSTYYVGIYSGVHSFASNKIIITEEINHEL